MRIAIAIAIAGCLAAAGGPAFAADVRAVDATRSRATFEVSHVLVQRVSGSVPIVSANVTLAPNSALPTALEATLDPKRVATGNEDRDADLQGDDWFDTAKYPQWTFKSIRVVAEGTDAFRAEGLLTIHGKSVPVTLAGTIVQGLPHPAYTARAGVDRHAFEMQRTRFDGMVGSEVTIRLDVVLK